MSSPVARLSRRALPACALALLLAAPSLLAATPAAQNLKVDIDVTVHNSDIGVSQETLDNLVEELLEEAGIQVEENEADSAAIQLKIEIYKLDDGKFKVVGDLDDPKEKDGEEDEEEREERETAAQDQIDDLVTAIVRDFIKLLRK